MTSMGGIHRERPGAEAITAATGDPAVALDECIWVSRGVSNSYAVATNNGRLIVNTGLSLEGPFHRRAFDQFCSDPTRAIIITQGHADHWGGVGSFRESQTDVFMGADYGIWRDDNARLFNFRSRNTSFGFERVTSAVRANAGLLDISTVDMSFPEPTVVVKDHFTGQIDGRDVELIPTPGGETTDSLVVWLPQEHVLFTGNLFGPLFGHVPNLSTIRGDRYRDPLMYIESLNTVLSLNPSRLLTGHFDPIQGADRIATEVTAMRDAMQWVHDRTIEGMEAGKDVHRLMTEITLPAKFDLGEGYGKTSWNVRSIWEMYSGWFHHSSTTELYAVPPSTVAADLIEAAGSKAILAKARARLAGGEPLPTIHLVEIVLSSDPADSEARALALEAHEALACTSTNFWEKAWLNKMITYYRSNP